MTKRRTIPGIGELFVVGDEKDAIAAIPSPKQQTDQGERERALDTRRSWIVEAPAGSGKTGLLIQRYLKLLAQPEIQDPEQVLAITFTLKASGEIRERVLEQLETATKKPTDVSEGFAADTLRLAAAVLERDRRLGWGLLEHHHRLNLRTIDSICAEIARSLPVLSGGSGLAPVEDADTLHRLAAERTLLQLGGADERLSEAISLVLLHRDGDLHRCKELLAEMLALRDQWGRLIPLDRESLEDAFLDNTVLPQLERTLDDAICTELEQVRSAFPERSLERLSRLAAEMAHLEGYKGHLSPIAICSGRYSPPDATTAELELWRALVHLLLNKSGQWRRRFSSSDVGFGTTREHCAELEEIVGSFSSQDHLLEMVNRVAALPAATFPREQWRVAKALFHVLYRGLAELQVVFAERGECDFTELGLLARTALHHGAGSGDTALRADLQHMLVDEMQDTSTSQYELIQLLTQGWDGRSQTIFLVGDPKQSIYLFRQARVERFVGMMKDLHIGDLRLGLLQLRSNFRSQPGLVACFNDIFSCLFPNAVDERRPDEAPYVAAEAVRATSATQNTVWHPQVISTESPEKSDVEGRLEELEAFEIRRIVEQWRARPLPPDRSDPWRIAVLVRNRSHLKQIVAAFKRDDGEGSIPFRAVDIEPLSERPEVLDLFALTRALLHPADRVAWLSVLRAPWCGLELSDLHILCGEDDPQWDNSTISELINTRGELLSTQGQRLLERVAPLLTATNRQLSRIPLPELVERTWRTLGGNTYLSTEELTNAERYFNILDETERQGRTIDLETLRQHLGDLYAAASTSPGAVDLMTIHGSKGLEWDVVFLPGLAKRARGDSQRFLVWDELSSADQSTSGVVLAPIVGKGRDSEELNHWLKNIHQRREEAECKRLFYVACTRAREELHLFATLKRRRDGSLSPAKGTLLAAAWPAAENHFVDSDSPSKPLIVPIVSIRKPATNLILPAVAAEENDSAAAELRRLPMDFAIPRQLPVVQWSEIQGGPIPSSFERPEGSFEARAFGSVIHAMLELVAARIATDTNAHDLLAEIPEWQTRIYSLLRSNGLSPVASERLVARVQHALILTLNDPHGLWLLSSRKDARSEYAMTTWDEVRSSVRLDRIFRAGDAPIVEGEEHLWIIDFKTAKHTGADIEEFLERERRKYVPQMETYARILRGIVQPDKLRLGLYYPLLPKLVWWTPED